MKINYNIISEPQPITKHRVGGVYQCDDWIYLVIQREAKSEYHRVFLSESVPYIYTGFKSLEAMDSVFYNAVELDVCLTVNQTKPLPV